MCTSKAYRRSHLDDLAKNFEKFRVDNRIPLNFLNSHDRVDDLQIPYRFLVAACFHYLIMLPSHSFMVSLLHQFVNIFIVIIDSSSWLRVWDPSRAIALVGSSDRQSRARDHQSASCELWLQLVRLDWYSVSHAAICLPKRSGLDLACRNR